MLLIVVQAAEHALSFLDDQRVVANDAYLALHGDDGSIELVEPPHGGTARV